MMPKVAVQILAYISSEEAHEDLRKNLESLKAIRYPKDRWCIVIVDNPSSYGSSTAWIKSEWMPQSKVSMPEIILVENSENVGFAAGHEDALIASKKWGADYVYLLNQDALCEPDVLTALIERMESNKNVALAQSRVMLEQDRTRLNSQGNCLQLLGFGYADGSGKLPEEAKSIRPHFCLSGAALMVDAAKLDALGGLFDRDYFMYHEDIDLSWRARLAGFELAYVPESVVYHRYEFSRSMTKFYWMERNRWVTHLSNLKIATLIFVVPPMIAMELGTMIFALKGGWAKEKLRVWRSLLSITLWKWVCARRRMIRALRRVPDREIVSHMVGEIVAQETDNMLTRRVFNPVMKTYLSLLKFVVRW